MVSHTSEGAPKKRRPGFLVLLPAILFLGLAGVFFYQLMFGGDPQQLPSALLNRPAPDVTLAALDGAPGEGQPALMEGFQTAHLDGQVSVVNIFASWCAPCREEHPMLMRMAQDERIQLVGINQKDQTADAVRFLTTLGNPFDRIGVDPNGRASIEWGVYGVPETFIVGPDRTILHKHIGAFTQADVDQTFWPIIEQALADRDGGR